MGLLISSESSFTQRIVQETICVLSACCINRVSCRGANWGSCLFVSGFFFKAFFRSGQCSAGTNAGPGKAVL